MNIFGITTVRPGVAALLLVLATLGFACPAIAEVSVSAGLSRQEVNSGDMAELQVKVTGAREADVPQQIAVEGLQVRLTGQSTQVQMVNFKVSSSVVYSYIVTPLRTGTFTIPPVTVRADGRSLSTPSLPFTVLDNASPGNAPRTSSSSQGGIPSMPGFQQRQPRVAAQPRDTGRLSFGEIRCARKSVYAGEMVPVEILFYFDARYPVQIRGKVDFGGEGILAERFPDPKESREERDGLTYNVLTFRTLLSAVKPGSIDIAPAKIDCQMQLPGALPPGFDDPVFQQLLGGQSPFNQARDLAVKTAPLHLDVLPLPREGRPASFAGAVGQFDIDAVVPNPKPAPGDPVTLSIKIGGKGNFNAMGAPVLDETGGWRSYPPTDKFDGSDELSRTGVKSYDFTLIAQEPKQASPGAVFSYFDPVAAKYVTLTTKPIPLSASPGAPSNAPVPPGFAASVNPEKPDAKPKPAVIPEGDPVSGLSLRFWSTPFWRPEFLLVTSSLFVACVALAGILFLRNLQARGGSPATRRRRRLAEIRTLLNEGSLDAAAAHDLAIEYAEKADVPPESRNAVLPGLMARRDVLKYGSGGSVPLAPLDREALLEALRSLTAKPVR